MKSGVSPQKLRKNRVSTIIYPRRKKVIGVEEERTAPKPAADPPASMPQRHKTGKFITCQMPWKKRYIFAFFFFVYSAYNEYHVLSHDMSKIFVHYLNITCII